MSEMVCNRKCFECKFVDCIRNDISENERISSKTRDVDAIVDESNISYSKKYYWNNHEKSKRWARESYSRNRERALERNKQYYNDHKENFREYNKRWKEEHKDLVKQRQHQYYLNWKAKKERMNANVDS